MVAPVPPEPAIAPPAEEDAGGRMSFFEHLLDLRTRLIYSAAAIAVGAGIGLLVSKHFIVILVKPMQEALRAAHFDDKLYFTSPAGYLTLVINIGLYLGVVLAMPFVLYQVWLFVAPGLYNTSGARFPDSSCLRCFYFFAASHSAITSCCRALW